jgi:hypothetical protein
MRTARTLCDTSNLSSSILSSCVLVVVWQAVTKFYADSLAAVPREALFQLEKVTAAAGGAVTVVW